MIRGKTSWEVQLCVMMRQTLHNILFCFDSNMKSKQRGAKSVCVLLNIDVSVSKNHLLF